MNNIIRRVIRGESGAAMALTVILLLVAGLVVASLLSFMGTGVFTGRVYEGRVAELYGADAGVEDAVWKIQQQVPEIYELYCGAGNHTWTYPEDGESPIIVNGRSVEVTIAYVDPLTYKVVSTATGEDGATQIEAYVSGTYEYDDYSGILDQVLTSLGQFYCPENKECTCAALVKYVDPGCGEENGPEADYDGAWPDTPDELERFADFYWQQVKNGIHYTSPIDLHGNNLTLDGGYLNEILTIIDNSDQSKESIPVLKLDGTVYITGSAQINPTQEMILDLNGQTIFADGDALSIGAGGGGDNTKLKIRGPGIIIAVGDIYFAPGEQLGGEDYPIFIFSISGRAELQPGGDFYGAIAAGDQVEMKSNNRVLYPEGGFGGYGLNFPGFGEGVLVYSIASWQVTPLAPSEQ